MKRLDNIKIAVVAFVAAVVITATYYSPGQTHSTGDADPIWLFQLLIGGTILGYLLHLIVTTRPPPTPLADVDPLTGLGGRKQLFSRLHRTLQDASDTDGPALMIIDIARFMAINKRIGLKGADHVLRRLANRLQAGVQGRGQAIRLGGDDFAVLIDKVYSQEEAEKLADDIMARIRRPVIWEGQSILLDFAMGISLAPVHGQDAGLLVSRAEFAAFASKENGGNVSEVFNIESELHYLENRAIERKVVQACETGGFVLNFQPFYDIHNKELRGFEALIRLPEDSDKPIPTQKFINVAENINRIDQIGNWVLRKACQTAASWPLPVNIAVNLSPLQFETGNIVDAVKEVLEETGLDPARLELEVTEGLMLHDCDEIRDQLAALRGLGVKLVLDDFGVGYSSLSYLWRYKFDKMKIDRSFTSAIIEDERARGILSVIVSLGMVLKLPITVEGVETEEQSTMLRDLGCDLVQGYHFSRPVSAEGAATELLRSLRRKGLRSETDDDIVAIPAKDTLSASA